MDRTATRKYRISFFNYFEASEQLPNRRRIIGNAWNGYRTLSTIISTSQESVLLTRWEGGGKKTFDDRPTKRHIRRYKRSFFGFVQVFGNDLKYSTLNGDREIREALTHLNPWEKFKQIISGKEIHHEIMFLDFTYVVPMTTGLPVRLDLAGSAACNFKMSGLLDTRAISKAEIEFISNVAPRYDYE